MPILDQSEFREQLGNRLAADGVELHRAELGRSHEYGKLFLIAHVAVDGVLLTRKVHIHPSLLVTGYDTAAPRLLAAELVLKCKEECSDE